MKLSDFVVREAILTNVQVATKEAAIGEGPNTLAVSESNVKGAPPGPGQQGPLFELARSGSP